MQETGLYSMLAALFALFSILSAIVAWRAARSARTDARRSRALSDELLAVHDRLDVITTALKRTEGRQYKAAQRAKGNGTDVDSPPDPKADPDGWKRWQNAQILLKGRQA